MVKNGKFGMHRVILLLVLLPVMALAQAATIQINQGAQSSAATATAFPCVHDDGLAVTIICNGGLIIPSGALILGSSTPLTVLQGTTAGIGGNSCSSSPLVPTAGQWGMACVNNQIQFSAGTSVFNLPADLGGGGGTNATSIHGAAIPTLATGYLHYNGSALIWDAGTGGGGGSSSWSALTAPTADLALNMAAHGTAITWTNNSSDAVAENIWLNIKQLNGSPAPNVAGSTLMRLQTATANPLSVVTTYPGTSSGFAVPGDTGNIEMMTNSASKFVGPILLKNSNNTTAVTSSPCLGTDANGNIISPCSGIGGGPATSLSWSSLTDPTTNMWLSMGTHSTRLDANFGATSNMTSFQLTEALGSTATGTNINVASISASHANVVPLSVLTSASGTTSGFRVAPNTGNLEIIGNAKLVGPVQLTGVNSAASLATDGNGNIIAGTGGGITGPGTTTVGHLALWGNTTGTSLTDGGLPSTGGSTADFAVPGWTVANGVSGGIPYFSSATHMQSTPALAASTFLMGGGAGNPPVATPAVPAGGIPCNTSTGPAASAILQAGMIITGGGNTQCPQSTTMTISTYHLIINNFNSQFGSSIRGQADSTANAPIGSFFIRPGDQTGNTSTASQNGAFVIRGSNNAASGGALGTQAGSLGLFGGAATGGGQNGFIQIGENFIAGATAPTVFNLQCLTTVSQTVQDCGATPVYIIGVAQEVTPNVVTVILEGEVPINCPGNCTVGHTVCAGATAGAVTDSGGTGGCTTGFLVGVVNRTTGAYQLPLSGITNWSQLITLTPTLPAIILLGHK
jgi:hypothetical protein